MGRVGTLQCQRYTDTCPFCAEEKGKKKPLPGEELTANDFGS